MKLLVAIESSNIRAVNKSARWAGRTGYDLRIFIKSQDWEQYVDRLAEINMNHYIHLTKKNLIVDTKPKDYAIAMGYDLMINIPEHRPSFSGKRKRIDLDAEIPLFAEAVGKARVAMGSDENLYKVILKRGINMVRI